ncbi:hypothetical protein FRD01_05345 [Microvenator marinus]|jgi:hypothetical protein|uniref:Uncharacterized protein n=1 Tax=Microvenator marinus TaxID=2600177 RepID=A0A5B8XTH8_9DELT|nr:hypothetical protein [Microvenator marinus]QED26679.1 hypothetical protein FRD01_05345 [Microvenator marinus]
MANDLKKIYVDFDGVLHAYEQPWSGPAEIKDGPVVDSNTGKDAIQWLTTLLQSGHFEVHIYSRRCSNPKSGGIGAMTQWLIDHGLAARYLKRIKFATGKPDYFLIIDDRAIGFDGHFPQPHELKDFKPWNR